MRATRGMMLLVLVAGLAAPAAQAQPVPSDWKEIRKPALRTFHRQLAGRAVRVGQQHGVRLRHAAGREQQKRGRR